MKTIKLIIISVILFLGMWIISWDTTFASVEAEILQIVAFFCLVGLVWILSVKSNLFRGLVDDKENKA